MLRQKLWLIVVSALIATAAPNLAVATEKGCISDYLEKKESQPPEDGGLAFGNSDQEVKNLVLDIGRVNDAQVSTIEIVTCYDTQNALAKFSTGAGSDSDIDAGEYLLYNPTFMHNTLVDKWEAYTLFAHEVAHFHYRHVLHLSARPSNDLELAADGWSACAVAKLNGSWESVERLFRRIRFSFSSDYPSIDQTLTLAKARFVECGGKVGEFSGIRVLYFMKASDDSAVEKVFKDLLIEAEYRASTRTGKSNELTCTADVDFGLVRKLAIALVKAGVGLRSIHLPRLSIPIANRISVEYEPDTDAKQKLKISDIEKMTECKTYVPEEPPPPPVVEIKVENICRHTARVYVRYKLEDGTWTIHARNLDEDEVLKLNAVVDEDWYYSARIRVDGHYEYSPPRDSAWDRFEYAGQYLYFDRQYDRYEFLGCSDFFED